MKQPRRVSLPGAGRLTSAGRLLVALVVVAVLAGLLGAYSDGDTVTATVEGARSATAESEGPDSGSGEPNPTADAVFAQAFADGAEDLTVEGRGAVTRLLADDSEGGRHQRFIVRLGSGQTLLIVHNIDVAPRVASLKVGDTVEFKGEYVWNEEGGLIHWTHRDPETGREVGWIRHESRQYE
jgi:hypothetical protein